MDVAAAVAATVPPPPPDPAVNTSLSADKSSYVSGEDGVAVLTAVVTDENSDAIGGLDASVFATTLDGIEVAVIFSETATPGTYTGSLDISSLADGTHAVETTVTDTRGLSGIDAVTFTIGPAPTEPIEAIVDSVAYATDGGKNQDKHLNITVAVADDLGNAVSGASVSIDLLRDGSFVAAGTGTTGLDGTVTFMLKNASPGCYEASVTNVTAADLTWDGATPANGFCK